LTETRDGTVERVIDANANRAREGLRVAEDFARFVVADEPLAVALRDARHRVTEAARRVAPTLSLLAARDAEGDLGADADAFPPAPRATPPDIAASGLKRAEEALRSLAEFAKLIDPDAAGMFERERYNLYDLEKRLLLAKADVLRMLGVDLCAVMDAGAAPAPADLAGAAVEAGAGCLVIEPGALGDEAAVSLGKIIREESAPRDSVLLFGGRADLARIAGADGVLIGPGDVAPAQARRVLGSGAVVGCKVPGADDAGGAWEAGATFVVMPFADMRQASPESGEIRFLAALAPEHVDMVIEAGADRIALSLPDSPEAAADLVRAAREALDREREQRDREGQ